MATIDQVRSVYGVRTLHDPGVGIFGVMLTPWFAKCVVTWKHRIGGGLKDD